MEIYEEYAILVRRLKAGEEEAFNEIYEKSKRLVYATCLGILNDSDDAKDAMQDTFLTVYNKIDSLDDDKKFLGWLKRIAATKALDMYRRKKGDVSYEDTIATEEELQGDDDLESLPDAYIMEKTKRDILSNIIRKQLSDVQYQTVIMYYYDELPVETIAKLMNCPEGTVKTRLKSSRIKIKEGVEEYESDNKEPLGLMAAAPFLGRFFSKRAFDVRVPSVKIPSIKTQGLSHAKAQADASKAATKVVTKVATKASVKAGLFATTASKIIAASILGVTLIASAIGIKYVIDNKDDTRSRRRDRDEEEEIFEEDLVEETEDISIIPETTDDIVPVVYDEPVEIPLSEVPEGEQLSAFVSNWSRCLYNNTDIPDEFVSRMFCSDSGRLVDLSVYFDDYSISSGKEDPLGIFIKDYCYSVNADEVIWVEENILNISEEDRDRINSIITDTSNMNSRVSGIYMYDGVIYYAKGEAGDTVSNEIVEVKFDGEYYYIVTNSYDFDDKDNGTKYYFTMELKNIDGKDYWSILSCELYTETNDDQVTTVSADVPEDLEVKDLIDTLDDNGWKNAYLDKIATISLDEFDDGNAGVDPAAEIKFDLIFVNGDKVPELAASIDGRSGDAYINVYTFVDDQVVMLGDTMYRYKVNVAYSPSNNIVQAGGAFSMFSGSCTDYWSMNDECNDIIMVEFCSYPYDAEKYSSFDEAEKDGGIVDGVRYYYFWDFENQTIIPATEDDSPMKDYHGNTKSIYCTMTADELDALLR